MIFSLHLKSENIVPTYITYRVSILPIQACLEHFRPLEDKMGGSQKRPETMSICHLALSPLQYLRVVHHIPEVHRYKNPHLPTHTLPHSCWHIIRIATPASTYKYITVVAGAA